MFQFRQTDEHEFCSFINPSREDKFARVFAGKASKLGLWPCLGAWDGEELAGAISWTVGKREPFMANLQLLHVFAKYRRKGLGTVLCVMFLHQVTAAGAKYFRVAAEAGAVDFYSWMGVKFHGRQKSGGYLSVARITGDNFGDLDYSTDDPVIKKAIRADSKGGCVEVFK